MYVRAQTATLEAPHVLEDASAAITDGVSGCGRLVVADPFGEMEFVPANFVSG